MSIFSDLKSKAMSSLKQKFNPLAALEEAMDPSGIQGYVFPRDELDDIDHWVTFKAFKTSQLDRTSDLKMKELTSIRLPMPANLTTGYGIQYSDENLGPLGSILADAFGNTSTSAQNAKEVTAAGGGTVLGGIAGAALGGNFVTSALSAFTLYAGTSGIMGGSIGGASAAAVADTIGQTSVGGAILANSGGLAVNPHKVVLFQGVGFRNHSFSFQFVPRSYFEAEEVTKIIRAFKYHGSPGYFTGEATLRTSNLGLSDRKINVPTTGKHFFSYPDFFTIDFHNSDHLFKIGPSVIERLSVDYHPLNTPAYIREEGKSPTPVQINIQIEFQETEIVTKEQVDAGR